MAAQLMATHCRFLARRMQVHGAGDQFLTGSGFSGDEDRGAAGANARQKLQDLLHARACDDKRRFAALGCHASP